MLRPGVVEVGGGGGGGGGGGVSAPLSVELEIVLLRPETTKILSKTKLRFNRNFDHYKKSRYLFNC